jgi:carboxyl-terminal processing protease
VKRKLLFIIPLLLFLCGLIIALYGTQIGLSTINKPIYLYKPSTKRFAKDALYIMGTYGVYAKENHFDQMIPGFIEEIENKATYDDVLPLLNQAIKKAGGNHSSVIEIDENYTAPTFNASLLTFPRVIEDDGIATIILPPFLSGDEADVQQYIDTSIQALTKLARPKGVIIDLRRNTGGNMLAMLGACVPFLKDGKLFDFVAQDKTTPVRLNKNQLAYENINLTVQNTVTFTDLPIAILTDNQTASSAEVLLIALKGQEDVQSFGEETAGYATGVTLVPLYGKYALSLAAAKIRGIDDTLYEEKPIRPDIVTSSPEEDAKKWIASMHQ